MTKNEVLNQLQEFSYELYKAGMRQAAGDYAYLVAWIKSEDWDNPLKEGRLRLPPEPLGVNTIDPYSHNCPIPYELIVPIDDYCRTIIDSIIELLESLQDFIDDETANNVIENYIIASGKTEYTYTTVELKSDLLGSDVVLAPGSYEFFNYYYNDTEYQIVGQLIGRKSNLNAVIVKAVDSEDNDVSVNDLSLAINDNKLSVVNNSSESVTISKLYIAYGDWCYGVVGANYSLSDTLANLSSNSLSALRYAPTLNNLYFDSALWKNYITIVGDNEIKCEEYQDYIWGERFGLQVSFIGTRVNLHNTSSHNLEDIHGIRWVNWFPEVQLVKSKVKALLEKDEFDYNNVAYLSSNKDLTDISVDGIFLYDNNGNRIPYDITKTYTITNVFGGTFSANDSNVELFNNSGFIGIKKTSVFTTDLAVHVKYSIANKVLLSCNNCGSNLDWFDICHNTECSNSPDYIPKCQICNSVLDNEGICHNTECSNSPDYIEYCSECGSIMANHICHNVECPNSPDYIEYCSECGSALDNEGICHNTGCPSSPDYIEYCSECGFELDKNNVCHNTNCVISPDYIVPQVLELDLYLRALSKNPVETHFGENDHWYSIIKSNSDLTKLTLFGHEASTSNDQLDVGFGCIKWNSDEFNYEFVGIYDSDGNSVVDYGNTSDNVYLDYNSNYNVLSIYTRDIAINSFCYTWRIRISKKPVITLYASAAGDSNELISEVKRSMYKSDGSGEYSQWESPTYEILNAATYNGNRLVWQGKSWANTYLKLSKNNGYISVINNSLYNVSIAAIKIIGTELKDCPNCGEEMDYENVCHNTECENSPDYIARCSNCDSELDNEGVCHNVDCELSPDYIEYCIECNSILVDHICHNNKCPNSPDYIEDEDPVVGGELSLTDDTSLTKVFRAPLVAGEFNLVESLNILSLDE